MAARFKIVIATTCGDDPTEIVAVSAGGELEGKWPAPATVHVDREGVGSAATVSVGSIVPDGATTRVLIGECPTARDIRVDDVVVGQVGTSTIVDAKGGHCYELMTSGFPSARLESKRTYERPLELFLPPEVPADKTVLRRCEHGSGSLASLMGTPTAKEAPPKANSPEGAFTANPLAKPSAKPPPPKPKPKPKPPSNKPRR